MPTVAQAVEAVEALLVTGPPRHITPEEVRDAIVALAAALAGEISQSAPLGHAHAIGSVTGLQGALDAKAPLDGPNLTGNARAPNVAGDDDSTKIANTAHVRAAQAAAVAAAVAADGTLAATIATALAGKVAVADIVDVLTATDANKPLSAARGKALKELIDAVTGNLAGQCRLLKSGADIKLVPYNGNRLRINGLLEAVPDAGVTLAPTGLTPDTLYYIYAWMDAGVMTLEASATAHAISTLTGNKGTEIKSGDNTRSLVGMVRPVTGPAFSDTATRRFARSWFNRVRLRGRNTFTADRTTTSTSFVELNSEIRCEFLVWADELVEAIFMGHCFNSGANFTRSSIGVDGTTANDVGGSHGTPGSNPAAYHLAEGLSEGYHYVTALGSVSAGTGTWGGGSGGTPTCTLHAAIG